jgi:hypothetical protein
LLLRAVIVLQEPLSDMERAMAEVLVEYAEPVMSKDGRAFVAKAYGAAMDNSRWQGWIEFAPVDGGPIVKSRRETTQPNRTDTEYWATGLTPVYLEGSLARSLTTASQGVTESAEPAGRPRESVLNPFSVYRKGESLLRNQLGALSGWHLVNIIEAYGLSEQRTADLEATPATVLVELIVSAVQKRTPAETSGKS